MKFLVNLRCDRRAQDLIEYALIAGVLTVTVTAVLPGIAAGINAVFSKVGSTMSAAGTQGSWGVIGPPGCGMMPRYAEW